MIKDLFIASVFLLIPIIYILVYLRLTLILFRLIDKCFENNNKKMGIMLSFFTLFFNIFVLIGFYYFSCCVEVILQPY